jgi:YVTN family beta-propeller protein
MDGRVARVTYWKVLAVAVFVLTAVVAALLVRSPSDGAHMYPEIIGSVEVGGTTFGVGVDAEADRLYVSRRNNQGLAIVVVQISSMSVVDEIPLEPGEAAHVVAVNAEAQSVYTVDSFYNNISFIDAKTSSVTKSIDSEEAVGPYGVAVDASRARVYWTEFEHLTVFDANTTETIARIPIDPVLSTPAVPQPNTGTPRRVAVNPVTNRVYVTSDNVAEGGGEVFVVDGESNSVVRSLRVGLQPDGIAANPSTNRIYVANSGDSTLSVIDGGVDSVVSKVQLPASPRDVAINSITNTVYVALGSGVAVVDGASGTVRTIDMFSTGLAVDEQSDLVYVAQGSSVGVLENGSGDADELPNGGGAPRRSSNSGLLGAVGVAVVVGGLAVMVAGSRLWCN